MKKHIAHFLHFVFIVVVGHFFVVGLGWFSPEEFLGIAAIILLLDLKYK